MTGGVLFDFSGTLFHNETAEQAVAAALGPQLADRADDLARHGAVNGSTEPEILPDDLVGLWERRDLSTAAHRQAYTSLARRAGLTQEQADALYARGLSPQAWSSYPETVPLLRRLRDAGTPVALVSNIGWDPRPVLERWDVADCFATLVLSYELGVQKPDARMFTTACERLGVEASTSVMIGDNATADGGSRAAGLRFVLVTADPSRRADDALSRAVEGR